MSGIRIDFGDMLASVCFNPAFEFLWGLILTEIACHGDTEAFKGVFHIDPVRGEGKGGMGESCCWMKERREKSRLYRL